MAAMLCGDLVHNALRSVDCTLVTVYDRYGNGGSFGSVVCVVCDQLIYCLCLILLVAGAGAPEFSMC